MRRPTPQLDSIGVANEEGNRRDLREMLFTSPGIEKYISGVVGRGRPLQPPTACRPPRPRRKHSWCPSIP